MKKTIIFGFIAVLMFTSCNKEKEDCNCGTIINDGISYGVSNTPCYWLEIRNDCTGNAKQFCFDYDVWFDGNVGEDFCVNNVNSW